jgi:DNA replication and repair protein RecF
VITDLRLQRFRSYKDASFEFGPGVNIIIGPNASGKTNLLEAILVLYKGSSYRTKDSAALLQFNKPWARLDGHDENGVTRTIKYKSEQNKVAKSYEINNQPYKRLGLAQTLPVVVFEPSHLRLLTGNPERRREYLDDVLTQTTPGYSSLRQQYKRTLSQRNALLKQFPKPNTNQMFAWNIRLSQLAGKIIKHREALTSSINKDIGDTYKQISDSKTTLKIIYKNRWPSDLYESSFLKALEANIEEDTLKGFTSTGPHREDLEVRFDGHLAQDSASRGELRTAILVLKNAELRLLEEARNLPPLLLLDDVFGELDGKRQCALTDYVAQHQTFITTTDTALATSQFKGVSHAIPLGRTTKIH